MISSKDDGQEKYDNILEQMESLKKEFDEQISQIEKIQVIRVKEA